MFFFFFSSRRRHTRCGRDWSSDLVECNAGKIRKLHFYNRPHSLNRGANRGAQDRVFANRRVQHAPGKFLRQTLGCFKCATEVPPDVLAVDENALIVAQQFCLRFPDRFQISDAHSKESLRSGIDNAHQSSLSPSGAGSFCAAAIASSTCATASLRHSVSVSTSKRLRSIIVCSATFRQSRANGCCLTSSVT